MIIKWNEFLEIGINDLLKRLNPQIILNDRKLELSYIKYDENINEKFQYKMIKELTHDGTLLFTEQGILEIFYELVNFRTCYEPLLDGINTSNIVSIEYTIGDLTIENKKKVMSTKGFPMIEEIFELPVYCELVLKED